MKPYFEGWYYKQQVNHKTLAIIAGKSDEGAFIQIITDTRSVYVPFALSAYQKDKTLKIGSNEFSNDHLYLCINHDHFSISGELHYRNLTPLKKDIMGPFRYFPMECRHEIISMKHEVVGEMRLNGETLRFDPGTGYMEADRGFSFPESYAWVQSNDFKANCSVMASVARIPFGGLRFWGCIGVVWLDGTAYRFATYSGAKIKRCEQGIITLNQGKYHLSIQVEQQNAYDLLAPKRGSMNRIIKESASAPAQFVFRYGDHILFNEKTPCAGYEYENGM